MPVYQLPDDGAHIAARELRILWVDDVCVLTVHEEGDPETPVQIIAVPRELAPRVAAELWPEVVEVLRALKPHAASHCQRFPGDGLRTCETTGMPRCFACAARHALAQLEPPAEGYLHEAETGSQGPQMRCLRQQDRQRILRVSL